MPSERRNVSHPLWRKKVDGSMFDDKCTVIPDWVKDNIWGIRDRFPHSGKDNPLSQATIVIHREKKNTQHKAMVTTNHRGKLPPTMRLFYEEDVREWLKEQFFMTYQRNEMKKKLGWNGPTVEKKIPFWEFIDIEYVDDECEFHFRAHYNLSSDVFTLRLPIEP